MKVIDFSKRGNVIRLYLGKDSLKNYYGDDWNDTPYEHNAGLVYEKFISGYIDFAIPYNYCVVEPSEDWKYSGNSPYCKDDFKNEMSPCLVIGKYDHYWDFQYSERMADKNCYQIYYNMKDSEIENIIKQVNGTILDKGALVYKSNERKLYDKKGNEFNRY